MYTKENNQGIYVEKQVRVPGFSMSYEHIHTYCEFFYLKKGNCIYSVNKNLYHLSAGDVFIVAPGDSHCTQYEGTVPCERIVIYCHLDILPQTFWNAHPDILEYLSRSGKVALTPSGRIQLEKLLNDMLQENNIPDQYSHEILTLLMRTLLLEIRRDGIFVYEKVKQNTGISSAIEDALCYIAQNFAMPLTLEEVAEKVNLGPTYLSRKFRNVTGTTFREYVNYIRIRQACQMLLTTDDSITKIAVNCGYNSSNYFKDCFRKANGVSPRTYRKQAKLDMFQQDTTFSDKISIDPFLNL